MKLLLLAFGGSFCLSLPSIASPHKTDEKFSGFYWFQNRVVSGKVTSENGESLANVTVQVKGTQKTALSAQDGSFSIELPNGARSLLFSYVGMETMEVAITESSTYQIQLSTTKTNMDEVVVVGYSTQKKINLTGSVATVSGSTLTQRPAPNAANLLQGRVPGLQVTQPTSEPGRDNANLQIRGRGSFNETPPLVLIDGVNGSLNSLSPDDIENVSVLKDAASAAIYGSRAANGVILITTKKGKKGQTVVSFKLNLGRQTAIGLPKLITNSAEYMEMYNAAAKTSGLAVSTYYPQTEIDKYRNATDRNLYPNFNAIDYWFRPATMAEHNLSLSGGSDKSTFNLSLSYLNQNTYIPDYNYKRYNGLLNYTNQISDKITVGTSINLSYIDREEPPVTSQFMALSVYATGPLYGPYLPDGSGRVASKAYNYEGRNRNVSEYALMGHQYTKGYNINAQAYVDVKLLKGLTWTSKMAVNYTDEFYKNHQVPYVAYLTQEKDPATGDYKINTFGPDILGVTDQWTKIITPTFYSTFNYEKTFAKDHHVTALAGYEQISSRYQSLRARRSTTAAPALDELSGYSATGENVYYFSFPSNHPRLPSISRPYEWALQSVFGRVSYNFREKYFVEGNLRYDGTSRVSPENRWGVFPSVSAAWIVSKEDFFREHFTAVSNVKLRASYGTLGNQDVLDNYPYQSVIDITTGYPFGNTTYQQGGVVNNFRDRAIRWESTRTLDFGIDLSVWRGLLGVTFDWYRKRTFDILAAQPSPASLGMTGPTFNNGVLRNQGIELEVTHQNNIGKLQYGVNAQITTINNKVERILVPSKGTTIRDVGYAYDAHYLYVWDGIFQPQDIGDPKVPKHALNPNPKPGDLKMKDVDGDGDVDANDRVVVDGAYPKYIYSFGFNVGYKGFMLTSFFQGVEGVKYRQTGWGVDPFTQGTAPTEKWRNAWTPQNLSNTLPSIYAGSYTGITSYQGSTFFLQDASYLRLKNVVLSYNFPRVMISRLKLKDLTLYISGDNLLTFTKFETGDPERTGTNGGTPPYPQGRIYNFGFNVKF